MVIKRAVAPSKTMDTLCNKPFVMNNNVQKIAPMYTYSVSRMIDKCSRAINI